MFGYSAGNPELLRCYNLGRRCLQPVWQCGLRKALLRVQSLAGWRVVIQPQSHGSSLFPPEMDSVTRGKPLSLLCEVLRLDDRQETGGQGL